MNRPIYVPLGRLRGTIAGTDTAFKLPGPIERCAYKTMPGALSNYVIRASTSLGAMLEAVRMSDTGKLGANPWRPCQKEA